jgi:hypothetical protein
MENINIKPIIIVIVLIVYTVIISFIIYKYIDSKMETKLQRHKKKLKKHYEKQFNQMFYNNAQNTNENKQLEEPTHDVKFEDNAELDGYDSNSSCSIESNHADTHDNPKILDDDYKKYGNEKMVRGKH